MYNIYKYTNIYTHCNFTVERTLCQTSWQTPFTIKWNGFFLNVLLNGEYFKWHLNKISYKHVQSTIDIPQFKLHSHILLGYLGMSHLAYSKEEEELFDKSYWGVLHFILATCYPETDTVIVGLTVDLVIWPRIHCSSDE